MKAARLLASEITQTGARVHDLLANEASERCAPLTASSFWNVLTTIFVHVAPNYSLPFCIIWYSLLVFPSYFSCITWSCLESCLCQNCTLTSPKLVERRRQMNAYLFHSLSSHMQLSPLLKNNHLTFTVYFYFSPDKSEREPSGSWIKLPPRQVCNEAYW